MNQQKFSYSPFKQNWHMYVSSLFFVVKGFLLLLCVSPVGFLFCFNLMPFLFGVATGTDVAVNTPLLFTYISLFYSACSKRRGDANAGKEKALTKAEEIPS